MFENTYFGSNPGPAITTTSSITQTPKTPEGYQVGQSTTDLVAFHGSTPVVQRSGSAQAAVATTSPTTSTPYGYTTSAQAAAIVTLVNEIRATLVEKGLMKGAA